MFIFITIIVIIIIIIIVIIIIVIIIIIILTCKLYQKFIGSGCFWLQELGNQQPTATLPGSEPQMEGSSADFFGSLGLKVEEKKPWVFNGFP
jgi:flagellar basal body-associated protein FliL